MTEWLFRCSPYGIGCGCRAPPLQIQAGWLFRTWLAEPITCAEARPHQLRAAPAFSRPSASLSCGLPNKGLITPRDDQPRRPRLGRMEAYVLHRLVWCA